MWQFHPIPFIAFPFDNQIRLCLQSIGLVCSICGVLIIKIYRFYLFEFYRLYIAGRNPDNLKLFRSTYVHKAYRLSALFFYFLNGIALCYLLIHVFSVIVHSFIIPPILFIRLLSVSLNVKPRVLFFLCSVFILYFFSAHFILFSFK